MFLSRQELRLEADEVKRSARDEAALIVESARAEAALLAGEAVRIRLQSYTDPTVYIFLWRLVYFTGTSVY